MITTTNSQTFTIQIAQPAAAEGTLEAHLIQVAQALIAGKGSIRIPDLETLNSVLIRERSWWILDNEEAHTSNILVGMFTIRETLQDAVKIIDMNRDEFAFAVITAEP